MGRHCWCTGWQGKTTPAGLDDRPQRLVGPPWGKGGFARQTSSCAAWLGLMPWRCKSWKSSGARLLCWPFSQAPVRAGCTAGEGAALGKGFARQTTTCDAGWA